MIIREINPKVYEINAIVKEVVYGNSEVDRYQGYDEATTMKLRCVDYTVMVFKRDFILFKNVAEGFRFKAIVHEWKENVYTFKKLVN